jgi:hypothetical protein
MREPWRTVIGSALLGLATAGAAYAYAAFFDYTKPIAGPELVAWLISVILCPPQLIFATCIDCEVVGRNGFVMYSIVGILNTILYALIGYTVVTLRGKRNSQNSNKGAPKPE